MLMQTRVQHKLYQDLQQQDKVSGFQNFKTPSIKTINLRLMFTRFFVQSDQTQQLKAKFMIFIKQPALFRRIRIVYKIKKIKSEITLFQQQTIRQILLIKSGIINQILFYSLQQQKPPHLNKITKETLKCASVQFVPAMSNILNHIDQASTYRLARTEQIQCVSNQFKISYVCSECRKARKCSLKTIMDITQSWLTGRTDGQTVATVINNHLETLSQNCLGK